MVRLDIGSWKSGSRPGEIEAPAEDIEVDPERFGTVSVTAEIDREGERIFIRLDVEGTAHLTCDRTLVPFDQPLFGSLALLYVPDDRVEAMADSAGDVCGYDPKQSTIDLTEAVRDTLLLSVPLRHIAPGADDTPIKTSFGTAEEGDTIDPRWEALRGLSDDDTDD
jgi:uncharacterized protein